MNGLFLIYPIRMRGAITGNVGAFKVYPYSIFGVVCRISTLTKHSKSTATTTTKGLIQFEVGFSKMYTHSQWIRCGILSRPV